MNSAISNGLQAGLISMRHDCIYEDEYAGLRCVPKLKNNKEIDNIDGKYFSCRDMVVMKKDNISDGDEIFHHMPRARGKSIVSVFSGYTNLYKIRDADSGDSIMGTIQSQLPISVEFLRIRHEEFAGSSTVFIKKDDTFLNDNKIIKSDGIYIVYKQNNVFDCYKYIKNNRVQIYPNENKHDEIRTLENNSDQYNIKLSMMFKNYPKLEKTFIHIKVDYRELSKLNFQALLNQLEYENDICFDISVN